MKVNLLPEPAPYRLGSFALERAQIRRGLIATVPVIIATLGLILTTFIQLQSAKMAQADAQVRLIADEAAARYPLDAQNGLYAHAAQVERISHALLEDQGGFSRGLVSILSLTNAFPPNGRIRIKAMQQNGGILTITGGEATDLDAAIRLRDGLVRGGMLASIDTSQHTEAAPIQWSGTVQIASTPPPGEPK